jgi:hypothetical protein
VTKHNSCWQEKKGFGRQIVGNQKLSITLHIATKNGFQSPFEKT